MLADREEGELTGRVRLNGRLYFLQMGDGKLDGKRGAVIVGSCLGGAPGLKKLLKLVPTFHTRTTDSSRETVTSRLPSGEKLQAEVVIGADGVHSMLREVVVGHECPPTPTGDAAYRAIIPTDIMMKDPDLRPLVENPEMTGWMGPGRHIMAYCIVSAPNHCHILTQLL